MPPAARDSRLLALVGAVDDRSVGVLLSLGDRDRFEGIVAEANTN